MASFYLMAAGLLLAANSPRSNVDFTKDSFGFVKKNVADGKAVLVDVRSEQEWRKGHIERFALRARHFAAQRRRPQGACEAVA